MKKKQSNKIILSLMIISSGLILTACAEKNNTSYDKVVPFEVDENTVHKNEYNDWIKAQTDENIEIIEQEAPEDNKVGREDNGITLYARDNVLGELILSGNDNSKEWTIENETDVNYYGVVFHDLYKCVNNLDIPCESNTFINFIIKTYQSSDSDIYVQFRNDKDENETADDLMTVHDSLDGISGYAELINQYNGKKVTWEINLLSRGSSDAITIYGCDKYMAYKGSIDTINIDMESLDTGKVIKEEIPEESEIDDISETSDEEIEGNEESEELE